MGTRVPWLSKNTCFVVNLEASNPLTTVWRNTLACDSLTDEDVGKKKTSDANDLELGIGEVAAVDGAG